MLGRSWAIVGNLREVRKRCRGLCLFVFVIVRACLSVYACMRACGSGCMHVRINVCMRLYVYACAMCVCDVVYCVGKSCSER